MNCKDSLKQQLRKKIIFVLNFMFPLRYNPEFNQDLRRQTGGILNLAPNRADGSLMNLKGHMSLK